MEILSFLLNRIRHAGTEESTFDVLFPKEGTKLYNTKGEFMCAYVDVLREDGSLADTAFSCHLDTVEHSQVGITVKPQGLVISDKGILTVKGGGILGADDGAGVWLLVQLIDNEISGRYWFFAGEESGGIGSKFATVNRPELFKGFSRAIAFDRKGTGDVIVSQYPGDCCSPQFGIALADALTCDKYAYGVADGIYTDTAEMIGLIPECVNISCGYYNEHTANESLDVNYLQALLKKALTLDWDSLPTVRDCKAPMSKSQSAYSKYGSYGAFDYDYDYEDFRKDADVDKVIDQMILLGITVSDIMDYIKSTGDVDLL